MGGIQREGRGGGLARDGGVVPALYGRVMDGVRIERWPAQTDGDRGYGALHGV